MPVWTVTLRDKERPTRVRKVMVDAMTRDVAISAVGEKSWAAYSATLATQEEVFKFNKGRKPSRKLDAIELERFCESMSAMLEAGVKLRDAIAFYAEPMPTKSASRSALLRVIEALESGKDAWEAFQNSGLFESMFVGMIEAGEKTSRLPEAFSAVAEFTKIKREASSQIFRSVVGQGIAILIMLVVFVVAEVLLVPQTTKILLEFRIPLDTLTRFNIALSNAIQATWIYFVLLIIGAAFLIAMLPKVRRKILEMCMVWKPLRDMVNNYRQLMFLSTFEMLVVSSIPIRDALDTCSRILKGSKMSDQILKVREAFREGAKLAGAISKHTDCDRVVSHMIEVGEETGTIKAQLPLLSRLYKRQLAAAVDRFAVGMNIVCYVFAIIVLLLVFSGAYLPVITLTKKILQQ